MSTHDHTPEALATLLAAQKQAFIAAGAVDSATRRRRIQTAIDLLVKYHKPLAAAMDEDFGGRLTKVSVRGDCFGGAIEEIPWEDCHELYQMDRRIAARAALEAAKETP